MNDEELMILILVRKLGGSVDITHQDYLDIDSQSELVVSHDVNDIMHIEIHDPIVIIDSMTVSGIGV